jgi:hypothetical protein
MHDVLVKERHGLGTIRELRRRTREGIHVSSTVQCGVDSVEEVRTAGKFAPVVGLTGLCAQDDGGAEEFGGNVLELAGDVCGILAGGAIEVESDVARAGVAPELCAALEAPVRFGERGEVVEVEGHLFIDPGIHHAELDWAGLLGRWWCGAGGCMSICGGLGSGDWEVSSNGQSRRCRA